MQNILLIDKDDLRQVIREMMGGAVSPNKPEKVEEKLYTASEACDHLRISKPTLHRWKKEGIIPHVRIGRNIRYRGSDIKELIERKK